VSEQNQEATGTRSPHLSRRTLLSGLVYGAAGASLAATGSLRSALASITPQMTPPATAPRLLRSFDYCGVRLLESPWQRQMLDTRDMYFNMNNDSMLKGYRRMAGLPTPGRDMAGWSAKSTSATFGQWLSGYARLSCALNDKDLRDKCLFIITEWEKTIGPDGDPRIHGVYGWEKLACGLVDAAKYADFSHALEILDRITSWAQRNFDRSRVPATYEDRAGRGPKNTNEWYTLSENLFRAYELTGNRKFLDFAVIWLYPAFWDRFDSSTNPQGAAFLHAYSHVNSFNSAAMAYAVLQDPKYLAVIRNAYGWARSTQSYASGGYGPGEWTLPADGSLGDALDVRNDHAEIPCGTWAGFKLSRHLLEFTGEARYGEWIEALLYNGIGAALPMRPDGSTFYYANYHTGMGSKVYFPSLWPCCSGTYIQDVADYHNVIYLHSDDGLYVNLLLPSEVHWSTKGRQVQLTLETEFPGTDHAAISVQADQPVEFALNFRVPSWCEHAELSVNGEKMNTSARSNEWMPVRRMWHNDKVTVRFPMQPRAVPVDPQHLKRIAVVYGPLLMVQDARYTLPIRGDQSSIVPNLTKISNLPELRLGTEGASNYNPTAVLADINMANGEKIGHFIPFWSVPERNPYRAYIDMDRKTFF
jgi:uncharacterized protein